MKQGFIKKQIIIGIAILAIIIVGIVFYQKRGNKVQTTGNLETETSKTETGEAPSQSQDQVQGGKITNESSSGQAVNTVDFNNYMKKAQDAFLSKKYVESIDFYNKALTYNNSDLAYSGMFSVYSAQKEWVKAQNVLDKAIALNSLNTDYWKWKISLLDEQTSASFAELKKVYEEGMVKSLPKARINLVIHFARIAEGNNQTAEAISLWQRAIELSPQNKLIYQAEIDKLKSL